MKLIDSITDSASQILHLNSDTGEAIDLTLRFLPAIQRWVMDVASTYINVNNIIIANHPNLLWSFASVSSFGIACISNDDVDPFQFDDFSSGRNELFLLNSDDIASTVDFVAGYPEP